MRTLINRENAGGCMAKLLIVDDEEDIREFGRNFFRKRGVEVFTASNGTHALIEAEKQKPDLILIKLLRKLFQNFHPNINFRILFIHVAMVGMN